MAKVWTVLVIFVVAINLHRVKTEQSILEKGKLAVLGAISKVKEIADRGVSVQSERQQSYDIFGMKLGTSNGIETGFGDAVKEKNHESIEDDLYRRRRRKRSLGVLDALRAAGLFNSNSAAGTNVNIVKINSVSNVNNYGPTTTPEVATESAKRRRRLIGGNRSPVVYEKVEQKVSYASSDLQMDKDGKFTSHTEEETGSNHMVQVEENEVDGPIVRNRRSLEVKGNQDEGKLDDLVQDDTDKIFGPSRAKRGLVLSKLESKVSYFKSDSEAKPDGSMRTRTIAASQESKLTKISGEPSSKGKHRAKRSPQEMDTDEMTTELPFTNGTGGPPRGGEGGRGGKGGRGGGRGRGRGGGGEGGPRGKGKGRRPPPPPTSEDDDEESLDDLRQKREADAGNESDSSYYSDSSSSEEAAQRKKREINAKADDENGAGGDSSDVSDSSFYSGSLSSESNESSSEEDNGSDPNAGGEEMQDDEGDQKDESQRVRRSPCRSGSGGGGRSTTLPPTPSAEQRKKREIESQSEEEGGEGGGNVERDLSFFTDVMEKFFKAVKKVADKAKQVFSGGSRDGDGSNPNAERI